MKENVIIGKLIPAGTGMKRYRNTKLDSEVNGEDELMFDDFDDLGDEDIMESVETIEVTETSETTETSEIIE